MLFRSDDSGAMTTSDGKVYLTISETHSEWSGSDFVEIKDELYSASFNVVKTDFQKTKVGLGAFEHEVILCSLGRIAYSSLRGFKTSTTGEVEVEFLRSDGVGGVLRGSETVFF